MTYSSELIENGTVSTTEASHMLRVSPRRVIQLSDAGKLPALRTPIGRLFMADAVERLALERAAA